MYTLDAPIKLQENMWYVGVTYDGSMYLRPDLTVQNSTGHANGYNVGFWPTEELAWEAYNAYYAKHKPKRIFTTSKG